MKTSKPTILFIMHMPPPVHGAAMMGKYIHDSELINQTFDCHYINLATANDLTDIGKFGFNKICKFVKLIRAIRCKIKRLKPNLVYVTPNACGNAFYKDFIVVQMIKSMGCKVVVHYHNKGVTTRQNRWFDNILYKRFFKDLKVILLSECLYNDVCKYVKRENVLICPNGIPETLKYEPSAKRNNDIPHLLFLSNLLISKGVLVLLDACKILKERDYSFICDFVGGETAEIDASRFEKEVADRGLNRVIIYNGKKYGDEKEKFFSNADVFVFPTFNESFGLVNLEAMEHKLPIVSTNEGGIIDVVKNGENGLICDKQNAVSLADCLEKLLNDTDLREKMGEDGYGKYKTYFTLNAFEKNFKDILTNLNRGGVKINLLFYHGKKYGEDKDEFYRKADIFVFPTFYSNECFPLVLLEAMQHGLPCISTNEGGIPDIIENGKTGYIIEKNDSVKLADKIEYLLQHPDIRTEMGERGYNKYVAECTLGKFENRMCEILTALSNQ